MAFGIKLAEYIPGKKRVYKNWYGKTIKTIELKESTFSNLEPGKISEFMGNLRKAGIRDFYAMYGMNSITATGEKINASSYIVKDANDVVRRANVDLRSGIAKSRYTSSFSKDGELIKSLIE